MILDSVSAAFNPGEVSVLLGPNGAGKSTFLKILSGVYAADSGNVSLGERALADFTPRELACRRGFLAQESSLCFDFSVEEVVVLGRIPHLCGNESAGDWDACARALALVRMTEFRHRRFRTLSGGEKQRIHLARVLAQLVEVRAEAPVSSCGSRWLLLDEPTSALDLRFQHEVPALVRGLAREQGFGVCAVLHDLNSALRYADKAVLLSGGRIAAAGPVRDVLSEENIGAVYGVRAHIREGAGGIPFIQTEMPGEAPAACN